ncbi:sensor histidine kinase [Spirosoma endophyticum]|uniref:histidine kinase n=1 Tax=Spirosoma endophyticum TaxID=662367 RepID=A0A1I2I4A2_9BACT|nr:ATP-binding protein [Spirosoma endophyticum]SFF37269.1 PAS fold-containing protein [Spirosoma endophyticum]
MTGDSNSLNRKSLTERLDIDFALRSAGLGVWEIDPKTNQVLWDKRCQALVGLENDNPIPFEEAIQYIHPDDLTRVLAAIQWAMTAQSGGHFDETYRTQGADQGALRWVRFWGQAHFSPAGDVHRFSGIAQEITQHVVAQQALIESEQLLKNLVLGAPIGISILNAADLVIETVNDAFMEVAGKSYEQLMGQPYWVPFAEAAPYFADALDRVAREGVPFSINETPLVLIRHGKEELIYVTFVYMPLSDSAGQVKKIAVWVLENTHQVTERRKVEELVQQRTEELAATNEELSATNEELEAHNEEYAVLNEELEEANSLLIRSNENLQQFAYVASHDLQEPLRKIQQFGDLLRTRYTDSVGDELDYIQRMQVAASRMSTLIKDLLDFSRISTRREANGLVSLDKVIRQVLSTLELTIAETGAQVSLEPLPTVMGDASQLNQLFQNLLSNALKFRRPGISAHISVKASWLAAEHLPEGLKYQRRAIAYHQIDVQDNGIGFDEKYLDRIFQVFQRLHGKSEYAGTGIGLAICEKVVANHGGAITATSQPGQGATFTIYLPA